MEDMQGFLETYIQDEEERLKSLRMQKQRYRRLQIQGMKELLNHAKRFTEEPANEMDLATIPLPMRDP